MSTPSVWFVKIASDGTPANPTKDPPELDRLLDVVHRVTTIHLINCDPGRLYDWRLQLERLPPTPPGEQPIRYPLTDDPMI